MDQPDLDGETVRTSSLNATTRRAGDDGGPVDSAYHQPVPPGAPIPVPPPADTADPSSADFGTASTAGSAWRRRSGAGSGCPGCWRVWVVVSVLMGEVVKVVPVVVPPAPPIPAPPIPVRPTPTPPRASSSSSTANSRTADPSATYPGTGVPPALRGGERPATEPRRRVSSEGYSSSLNTT
ncbi:hypothetical protein VTO42DRAFT_340 [Malbranchea cinnamomea]